MTAPYSACAVPHTLSTLQYSVRDSTGWWVKYRTFTVPVHWSRYTGVIHHLPRNSAVVLQRHQGVTWRTKWNVQKSLLLRSRCKMDVRVWMVLTTAKASMFEKERKLIGKWSSFAHSSEMCRPARLITLHCKYDWRGWIPQIYILHGVIRRCLASHGWFTCSSIPVCPSSYISVMVS